MKMYMNSLEEKLTKTELFGYFISKGDKEHFQTQNQGDIFLVERDKRDFKSFFKLLAHELSPHEAFRSSTIRDDVNSKKNHITTHGRVDNEL